MIGQYCRNYRVANKATLKDIEKGDNVKSLSAFEMGRSTNINHFLKYVEYSKSINDYDNFMLGIKTIEGAVA